LRSLGLFDRLWILIGFQGCDVFLNRTLLNYPMPELGSGKLSLASPDPLCGAEFAKPVWRYCQQLRSVFQDVESIYHLRPKIPARLAACVSQPSPGPDRSAAPCDRDCSKKPATGLFGSSGPENRPEHPAGGSYFVTSRTAVSPSSAFPQREVPRHGSNKFHS
jgi:hypothetical protein